MRVDLSAIDTEARNASTMDLDTMSPLEIAEAMNREDARVADAVREALPEVAQAIQMAGDALGRGGRIFYLGAGTSGRLGVLDASECPPTFGVSPDLVVGIIAGGDRALRDALEGVEDSPTEAARQLGEAGLGERDLVVGLAASGRTPYVVHGLRHARSVGAATVAISCSRGSDIGCEADLSIEVSPGPEVLTGSTRLKAGTAEKLILNMISTGAMVLLGKVYQNLMVDLVQSNDKLQARAVSIVSSATGCTADEAAEALRRASGSAKTAIVMIARSCDAAEAQELLQGTGGHVRQAIERAREEVAFA